jgi:ribonucleotide reductase alpha subunit
MEAIAYYALLASAELAQERGSYASYAGSKWQRGILPIDSLALLESERGADVEMDRTSARDWGQVRAAIRQHGMRNSNVLAIAPTATISTIVGASQSIEPDYTHLSVKSNLSGEFTTINAFLVNDLKAAKLWNAETLEALKYYDGSLQKLPLVPDTLKQRYLTAFEIDPAWLIECASRRQKWIDMGQSLNLYLEEASGKKLHDLYLLAWKKGLKTTYYLRTRAATQIEKSTVDINLDPTFSTAGFEGAQQFLKNLIGYYVILEGIFFYSGFAMILSFHRRNLMTGIGEQFQYILRDETIHLNFGIDLINGIKAEHPELWTPTFQQEILALIQEAVELEVAYAQDCLPQGILGLRAESFRDYVQHIADRRLERIGFPALYHAPHPFPWLSETIDLGKAKNFFETRVTEYQAASTLQWD